MALGGGSVIDTCKYIAVAFHHDGDAWDDFYAKPGKPEKVLPVGSVTTLAGTGSEASNSSVVTKNGLKRSFNNDCIRPAIAIMNPELTYTLPPFQTAAGGVDIMAHVHERYFTLDRNTYLTDGLCEAIFRTIIKYLPIAVKDPTNYEARAEILWASIIGHNESVGVGRSFPERYGLAHTMQSEIGGRYDSNHGAGCACCTIGMMKYLYKRDIPRFERYFNQVWGLPIDPLDPETMILKGIKMQEDFYHSLGISTDVKDYGVKAEDLPALAATTRKGPDGLISGMKLTEEDIINIYKLMGAE
ncbi:MAG: iron-containing alcohol dehydrogenase [Erysipelotrichaceae bacterium]|nr:iron-containing alcohol dehydrogenase [Erysipelotrichaceae bacterium]